MMQLLINADDFGYSESCNKAIDYCFKSGLIDRATVMVNMPGYNEAVKMAFEGGYDDRIGLHINLVEGVPLTYEIKQTVFCKEGKFNSRALRMQHNRFFLNKYTRHALYVEICAQIDAYLDAGFVLKHVDSHEHSHTNWSVLQILLKCFDEYNFKTLRLSRNIPPEKINIVKKIYKNLINAIILKKNIKRSRLNNLYFGSQTDVTECLNVLSSKEGIVEMMIHPIWREGDIADAFNKANIYNWLCANPSINRIQDWVY